MVDIDRALRFEYVLHLGDSNLVLGQRLAEWCSHAPALEEDLALTNIALDLIGQARLLLGYAGEIEGRGRSEDDLAYFRDGMEFRNLLLVEQPNGDFARTLARQFLFDAWTIELYRALARSSDERLAAIAEKAERETRYHLRHSSQWLVRLGDGTDESHARAERALGDLWTYTGELFTADDVERPLIDAGIAADPARLRPAWEARVASVLEEATLARPADGWMQQGGKRGLHSEHLGYLLAEMQSLRRAHPEATAW
jgi:ring-1,2-phenylacetyl-CoA epoxidase subunit PaaC